VDEGPTTKICAGQAIQVINYLRFPFKGWEADVDFIEKFLGISPDRGDHSLEVMLLVVTFTLIGALALFLSASRKAKDDVHKKL
jgi:hypothetical protein